MYKSIILIFGFIIAINAQNIFELVKLPIEVNNVNSPRCLDGTAAGYYKRIGTDGGKTVMIHLEGGGWCTSYEDCLARSNTDIGSSKNWPLSGVPSMDGGSNGMFSNNCTINPQFCKVSMFHFNYCDGASHAGHQDHAIPVTKNNQSYELYFRGQDNLDGNLNSMIKHGYFKFAENIIIKGCSAGGLATIIHIDNIVKKLKMKLSLSSTKVVNIIGMPDAGYFLNHNNTLNEPSYTPKYQWVVKAQNVLPNINSDCINYYRPRNESWKCFMAQYVVPFVQTPLFFSQDLFDSWQLANIYELNCNPFQGGNCNSSQIIFAKSYYKDLYDALLEPVFSNTKHGGFFTGCVEHGHQNLNYDWNHQIINGQSLSQTMKIWYDLTVYGIEPSGNLKTKVIDSDHLNNPTCRT